MERFEGCTLAILAGGRARRLGGVSKPHLRLPDGRTVLVRTLELFAPLVDDVVVITDDSAGFRGLRTFADRHRGKGAPGGLHAACEASRTPWVLVLAGDLPCADPEALFDLWRERDGADAVAFVRDGRVEPLHAFYRADHCLDAFDRVLRESSPSAQELVVRVSPHLVAVTNETQQTSLENVNTPEDVLRLGLRLPLREPDSASALRPLHRVRSGVLRGNDEDRVAVEEPLEIRIDGETVAVTMRTPGDDRKLVLGYLLAEGLISSADDVGAITHCGRPGSEEAANVMDVRSGAGRPIEIERVLEGRRWTTTTSACGVCGRRSISDLLARCPRITNRLHFPSSRIASCVSRLRDLQPGFARTGGVHAAAAFDFTGRLLACHEDVGRHNAVDKTVGALMQKKLVGEAALLVVSGRASFEIVQKAAMARIPVVASVSAPSTLAIDLAEAVGVTLASFVRGDAMNVYSHAERIAADVSGEALSAGW